MLALDTRMQAPATHRTATALKHLHDQINRATMQACGWDDLIPLLSLSSSSGEAQRRPGDVAARESANLSHTPDSDTSREQIAFGAAASPGPGFARPEDDESKKLDEIILERLVALNAERAAEEAAGHVRWLRPDDQIPRFAKAAAAARSATPRSPPCQTGPSPRSGRPDPPLPPGEGDRVCGGGKD